MHQEEANTAVVEVMTRAATKYATGEISATEFAQQLTLYMTDDVEFWSNYTPSYEPLRPLFAPCRGVDEIVARYSYENENEAIEHGSGIPYDSSISGDVMYYTQTETAAFFDKPATWSPKSSFGTTRSLGSRCSWTPPRSKRSTAPWKRKPPRTARRARNRCSNR